ncbi:zona pellucida sperm-binding protein 3-like [Entelurus aequoreus]|uniref:zona pellucida sperm-binding protein 3-like n=1 Tax=Entelurus aequoreus TaxID=161455 RepID=UPI002B1D6E81|nr:zona pellucida sperm-binding protein 3-like [Entelurus aequoreus]
MASLPVHLTLLLLLLSSSSLSLRLDHFSKQSPAGRHRAASKHDHEQLPVDQRRPLNTVSVTCHPDSLEILIRADLFGVGAPVDSFELRLGVDHDQDICRATPSAVDQYRILVRLLDCGTKYWMNEESLVYTNLLIYTPAPSPDGLIRMDEAVIPIECHYKRRYSLSSSSLSPTWVPFRSTQAAVESLDFNLRIMSNDWQSERSSNVYFLGESMFMEASVRVGHHMGLRVFLSSCVATLQPDIHSVPRYVFIEHGCLLDSKLPGSKSHFVVRTQDDKLQLVIDAFKFHNEDRGELYITCHLNAVPVTDAEVPNKACTFVNGRWRSADGNDYLCGYCQSDVGQTLNKPAKFGPRGFSKMDASQPQWRSSRLPANVWEDEARVGPMLVLPAKQKSWMVPEEEQSPILQKFGRPQYGSQWKSGLSYRQDLEKGLLPSLVTSNQDEELTSDNEDDIPLEEFSNYLEDDEEDESGPPEHTVILPEGGQEDNSTLDVDLWPVAQSETDVTLLSNSTDSQMDQSVNDPKR